MASPPGSSQLSPLALPRQRPSLALPGKTRKPSISSTTSSAHPLRQTSFPPESLEAQHFAAQNALRQFSPSQASQASLDDVSDSEIVSAISGPAGAEDSAGTGRKRKRTEKRNRGRPAKNALRAGSQSLVNGEDGTNGTPATKRGEASLVDAEDDDDEDDDIGAGGGRVPLYEGGQMTAAEYETDNKAKAMFRRYVDTVDAMPLTAPGRDGLTAPDMGDRYDVYNRAKLKKDTVRKLVNQTLSQSVPVNVVTVVSAYTKMFAGLLIEQAREVQAEWLAMEEKRADGEDNPSFKRVKTSQGTGVQREGAEESESNGFSAVKLEKTSTSPPEIGTQQNGEQDGDEEESIVPGAAGGLSASIEECDRGPLLPDHLREALRRYKKSRKGGTVGFTGLSLEGRESAAPRLGGRRLFR